MIANGIMEYWSALAALQKSRGRSHNRIPGLSGLTLASGGAEDPDGQPARHTIKMRPEQIKTWDDIMAN